MSFARERERSPFVLEYDRGRSEPPRSWKCPQDIVEFPIIDVENQYLDASLASMLRESVKGRQVRVAPGRNSDYKHVLVCSWDECLSY